MGRWNFDVIFSGDMEEQAKKAGHFQLGLRKLIGEAQRGFARGVLVNDPVSTEDLNDLHEMAEAFDADPRTVRVREWVSEQSKKEKEERLVNLLRSALRE